MFLRFYLGCGYLTFLRFYLGCGYLTLLRFYLGCGYLTLLRFYLGYLTSLRFTWHLETLVVPAYRSFTWRSAVLRATVGHGGQFKIPHEWIFNVNLNPSITTRSIQGPLGKRLAPNPPLG